MLRDTEGTISGHNRLFNKSFHLLAVNWIFQSYIINKTIC